MSEESEQDEFEGVSPEDTFALLGNEIRISIIHALGKMPDDSLSFSALRTHVDVADSGQFNYHLKELLGSFVRRTDESEYELTYAGRRVIGAILSGTFNQRGDAQTFELNSECDVCGSPLLAVEYGILSACFSYRTPVHTNLSRRAAARSGSQTRTRRTLTEAVS